MLKVGTICIGQNFRVGTHRNGVECEIIKPYDLYPTRSVGGSNRGWETGYVVRWADGVRSFAAPHNIRPKKPPAEYKGEKSVMDLFLKVPQHA